MSNETKYLSQKKKKRRTLRSKKSVQVSQFNRRILQPGSGEKFQNTKTNACETSSGIYRFPQLKLNSICSSEEEDALILQALRRMDEALLNGGISIDITTDHSFNHLLHRYISECKKLNPLFDLFILNGKVIPVITEQYDGFDSMVVPLNELLNDAKKEGGLQLYNLVINVLHYLSKKGFCFFDELVLDETSLDFFDWMSEEDPEAFQSIVESYKNLSNGKPAKTLAAIKKLNKKKSLQSIEKKIATIRNKKWRLSLIAALAVIKSPCSFRSIAHRLFSDGELYPYQYMHFCWSFNEPAETEYYAHHDDTANNVGVLPFFSYKKINEVGWGSNLDKEGDFFLNAKQMMLGFRKIIFS
jgi:hypothetical protein